MIIHVELDEAHARKLAQLKRWSGLSTSRVVMQAISLLYDETVARPESRMKALLESDFIGCAEGPANLSENYKR